MSLAQRKGSDFSKSTTTTAKVVRKSTPTGVLLHFQNFRSAAEIVAVDRVVDLQRYVNVGVSEPRAHDARRNAGAERAVCERVTQLMKSARLNPYIPQKPPPPVQNGTINAR